MNHFTLSFISSLPHIIDSQENTASDVFSESSVSAQPHSLWSNLFTYLLRNIIGWKSRSLSIQHSHEKKLE